MHHPYLCAAWPRETYSSDTSHVRAEIVYPCGVVELPTALGTYGFDEAYRRHGLRRDGLCGSRTEPYALPMAIVEVGQSPCPVVDTEVYVLASVDIIVYKVPSRGLPREVGGDGFCRAVGIFYAHIHAEGGAVAPWSTVEIPHGLGLVVVPSVAQHHAEGILSFVQRWGNVERYVQYASVVACKSRV